MKAKARQSGKKHRSAFETLQRRVAEAHWRWKVWKQLFSTHGSSPDEQGKLQALMNTWSHDFFVLVNEILFQDVVLRICKLFDPPSGGPAKRTSLSLAAARENAKGRLASSVIIELKDKTLALQRAASKLEQWRNRRFAHDDERTSIGAETLPAIQVSAVDRCLAMAVAIIEVIDPNSATASYRYDGLLASGDGESIKFALACAQEYKRECLAAGCRPLSEWAKTRVVGR